MSSLRVFSLLYLALAVWCLLDRHPQATQFALVMFAIYSVGSQLERRP